MRATQKYKSLPYNPNLRERARALRKAGIMHEALLWQQLKSRKLHGLDFDRQKIIGNYIVDFYCAEKGVVIEIDGTSHNSKIETDRARDNFLNGLGLTVIRISAGEVMNNMEGVVTFLSNHPALTGTPPQEGNIPALTGTPPQEGNIPALTGAPPQEGK
jgi:very-short-patch-repair endonuclease